MPKRTGPFMVTPVKRALSHTALLVAAVAMLGCGGRSTGGTALNVQSTAEAGNPDAPYEVVIYSDFQCPYCRMASEELGRLVKTHPERIHLYFKHFPLRQHPQAQNAAAAAEAARIQGKFWEMHDLLFRNAPTLSAESYGEFAAMLGLDTEQFRADFTSRETADRIAADRAEADAVGLDGTPFFVVNGTPYTGDFYELIKEIEFGP